ADGDDARLVHGTRRPIQRGRWPTPFCPGGSSANQRWPCSWARMTRSESEGLSASVRSVPSEFELPTSDEAGAVDFRTSTSGTMATVTWPLPPDETEPLLRVAYTTTWSPV